MANPHLNHLLQLAGLPTSTADNVEITGSDLQLFPATPEAPEAVPMVPIRPPVWAGWKCDSARVRGGEITISDIGPEVPNVAANWGGGADG